MLVELREIEPLTFSLRRLRRASVTMLKARALVHGVHGVHAVSCCWTLGAHRGHTSCDRFHAIRSRRHTRVTGSVCGFVRSRVGGVVTQTATRIVTGGPLASSGLDTGAGTWEREQGSSQTHGGNASIRLLPVQLLPLPAGMSTDDEPST